MTICNECSYPFLGDNCPNPAYIQGWLGRLRNDPKLVVIAAAKAQKASDFILGTTFES